VQQGQLLLAIDPRPYDIALRRAQANHELAMQARAVALAAVDAASAQVTRRQAEHNDAADNNSRMQRLLKSQSVSKSQADTALNRLRETEASLKAAGSSLEQAQRELKEAGAKIQVAEAALSDARLKLSYTRITAPASGVLGELSVRPGDVVTAGQQLFPLVQDRPVWVDANFKETDLERIKPGQPAVVAVDMYPGKTFRGRVESLSPASGTAFALLPPENATGNWVKVTQRFPVRVLIPDVDAATPLRIGASSTVTIDTVGHRQAGPGTNTSPADAGDAARP
jgi:membrane fusion protein (multidrug efflux system)